MKLNAFTIAETITAMIVIMISFSAAMLLYFSMLNGDAFSLKTKANNLLDNVYHETQKEQRFIDEALNKEGFLIKKVVLPYTEQANLSLQQVYQLTLQAFTPNDELIAEQQHLIRVAYEK